MKLKELYLKLYDRVFSVPFFKKILEKFPFLEKVLAYEIISYLVFGVLTTVVNLLAYYLINLIPGKNYESLVLFTVGDFRFLWLYFANAVAWIVAVLFSYFTNKLFVFESRSFAAKTVLRELVSFIGARLASFLIFEELLFGVLINALHMNDWLAKIAIAVFVVVFNYVMSKLVIFRKKKTPEDPAEEPAATAPEEGSDDA